MKFTLKIKKGRTFKYIFRRGKYTSGNYLSVHICKTKYDSSYNFFGVCVSKKNGKSVQRNKLKRWVREVYKCEESKIKKGYNIVVLYKKTTEIKKLNLSYEVIRNDMVACFKKLKLYENT